MQIHIETMTCGGCLRGVTRAVQGVDPAAGIAADPPPRKLTLQTDRLGADVLRARAAAGFDARLQPRLQPRLQQGDPR